MIFSVQKRLCEGRELPGAIADNAFTPDALDECVSRVNADILLFEQWFPLTWLKRADQPIVLDIPGPLILENHFRGIGDLRLNVMAKIRALNKADYFLYTTQRQRWYWIPWLLLAGVEPGEVPFDLLPICLAPDMPECQTKLRSETERVIRFIHGGVFWAWQDPYAALRRVLAVLERRQAGSLFLVGGKHPYHEVPGQQYLFPEDNLPQSERLEIQSMMSLEALHDNYCQGGVALDLMEDNIERELSCTVRNIGYMWCGLPVIVRDYSYLAEEIREYEAGWVLENAEPHTLETLIESILDSPEEIVRRGLNAQRLVRERHNWSLAARPLLDFCEFPKKVSKGSQFMKRTSDFLQKQSRQLNDSKIRVRDLEKQIDNKEKQRIKEVDRLHLEVKELNKKLAVIDEARITAERDLHLIRSKLPFKLYKRISRLLFGRER